MMSAPTTKKVFSWAALIIALFAAIKIAANLVRLALNTNRGIDISDEGLAIASAMSEDPTVAFTGLSGSYIRFLWLASGEDVARFRLLGLLVAVIVCIWLAVGAFRYLPRDLNRCNSWATKIAIVTTTVGGFSFLYPHYTPTYQWLVLVGLGVAAGSLLRLANPTSLASSSIYPYAILLSVGCFLSTWGRPFSGAIFWIISMIYLFLAYRNTRAVRLRLIVTALGALCGMAVIHLLFIASLNQTVEVYRRTSELLALSPTHEWGRLLSMTASELVELPGQVFTVAWLWPFIPIVATVVILLLKSGLETRSQLATTISMATGLVCATATGILIVTNSGIEFLGKPGSYVSYVALLLPVAFSAVNSIIIRRSIALDKASEVTERESVIVAPNPTLFWIVVIAVALCPFLYGFTSDNGVTLVAGWVGGFLTLATVLIAIRYIRPIEAAAWLTIIVATVCSIGFGHSVQMYFDKPVRQSPIAESTIPVTVTPNGAELEVSPEMAIFINTMSQSAKAAGFTAGTPLVDLSPFSSMVGVTLGAKPTATIYLGTQAMADITIAESADELHDAWLLTLDQKFALKLDSVKTTALLGRKFPDDYTQVATAAWPNCRAFPKGCSFTLWKPR